MLLFLEEVLILLEDRLPALLVHSRSRLSQGEPYAATIGGEDVLKFVLLISFRRLRE